MIYIVITNNLIKIHKAKQITPRFVLLRCIQLRYIFLLEAHRKIFDKGFAAPPHIAGLYRLILLFLEK